MNMLDNLTIIIPTYNRLDDVIRTMKFWSGKGPQVHVLDGSTSRIDISEYSFDDNINYYYINSSFYERMKFSLNIKKTKYTLLHADDEFHLPENLNKCIDFLESNHDYGVCIGQCLSFIRKNNIINFHKSYTNLIDHQVCFSSPNERLNYHFSNYIPTSIYGVCRSSYWDTCISFISEQQFSSYAIDEYQFEGMMSLLGNMKVIEDVTWLRNNINRSHGGTANSNSRDLLFHKWWEDVNWLNEKREFLEICEKYNVSNFEGRVCFKCGYDYLFNKMKIKYNLKMRLILKISDFLGRHRKIYKIRKYITFARKEDSINLTTESKKEILTLLDSY
jgi:glycosyltransferase domain-containing protein